MKKVREPIYLSLKDISVKNDKTPAEVTEEILQEVLNATRN